VIRQFPYKAVLFPIRAREFSLHLSSCTSFRAGVGIVYKLIKPFIQAIPA
jgi:hypothetical protein